jgi:hypothetical protein
VGAATNGALAKQNILYWILDMHLLYDADAQVILPNYQKQKLIRPLITMQMIGKTNMEDRPHSTGAAVKNYSY